MSTRHSAASAPATASQQAFADDVARGLSARPRQLAPRYFYDDLGSALFEAICRLPWYGITRSELHLLGRHALDILRQASPVSDVVDLGPGYGGKLSTFLRSTDTPLHARVHLIDVSAAALDAAAGTIRGRPDLAVRTYEAEYDEGLSAALAGRASTSSTRLPRGGRALVLFLGSNVGNLDPTDAAGFLRRIRARLAPGDGLLLGTDLVKPERDLLLAYDDPLGITAAFNRNLLVRINRELDGDFDVASFSHRAVWNAAASRVEMHLVSDHRQTATIPAAGVTLTFEAGESIWTESSYKYTSERVVALLAGAGFDVTGQWVEEGFALTFARAARGFILEHSV
jgi:dimethylhistidine N-methyltransferase